MGAGGGNNKDTHQCQICGRAFGNPTALLRHNETHERDMPFPCVICKKRFGSLAALAKHKAVHRPADDFFRCRQCGQRFLAAADFVRHKLQHQRAEYEEEVNALKLAKKETEMGDRVKKGLGAGAKGSPKPKRGAAALRVGVGSPGGGSGSDGGFDDSPGVKRSVAASVGSPASAGKKLKRKKKKNVLPPGDDGDAVIKTTTTFLNPSQKKLVGTKKKQRGKGDAAGAVPEGIMFPKINHDSPPGRSDGGVSVADKSPPRRNSRTEYEDKDDGDDGAAHPLQRGPRRVKGAAPSGSDGGDGGAAGDSKQKTTIWGSSRPKQLRLTSWEEERDMRNKQRQDGGGGDGGRRSGPPTPVRLSPSQRDLMRLHQRCLQSEAERQELTTQQLEFHRWGGVFFKPLNVSSDSLFGP
jgi:hypothetical protein